jgi:hypothetical protein
MVGFGRRFFFVMLPANYSGEKVVVLIDKHLMAVAPLAVTLWKLEFDA